MRALFSFLFISFLSIGATHAADKLSFEQAVQKSVERNTNVGAQQAQLKSLESLNLPKHLTYLPSINLEASHNVVDSGSSTISSRSAGASARLNIFKFGADAAIREQAKASETAQKETVRNSVLRAENEAVRTLTSFIAAQMVVSIRNELVDIRKNAHDIASARYRKGLLSKQEVSMAEVDLNNSIAQLRDAETNLVAARANLFASVGVFNVEDSWPWISNFSNTNLSQDGLKTLQNRPDWKAARASVRAAEAQSDANWGQMLPSLDLIAGYGYTHSITRNTSGTELTGSLTLSIPLFDKLSNYGNYRSAVYTKARSEFLFEQVRRDARADWESAKGAFKIAFATAQNRDKTVKASESVYQDDLKRFRKGAITINDVNIALTRLFNSKLLAVQGWQNTHNRFIDLCHSVGKKMKQCLE